ncbi:hypothetical protein BD560DRAFT_423746 [Blakeslea trispora]|nr:hypothetical protein BD560DRAFT_423746 [Blakeslea trispora]
MSSLRALLLQDYFNYVFFFSEQVQHRNSGSRFHRMVVIYVIFIKVEVQSDTMIEDLALKVSTESIKITETYTVHPFMSAVYFYDEVVSFEPIYDMHLFVIQLKQFLISYFLTQSMLIVYKYFVSLYSKGNNRHKQQKKKGRHKRKNGIRMGHRQFVAGGLNEKKEKRYDPSIDQNSWYASVNCHIRSA